MCGCGCVERECEVSSDRDQWRKKRKATSRGVKDKGMSSIHGIYTERNGELEIYEELK